MALEIVWTKQAEKGFGEIISYLEKHFTEKEVKKFITQSNDFFELLCNFPEILKPSGRKTSLHRGPLNKHTIIT